MTKKNIFLSIIVLFVFSFGFYLSWQRQHSTDIEEIPLSSHLSNQKSDLQERSLKRKLADDFESAFLKQYTPLLGCEKFHTGDIPPKCRKHLEQSKNDFKDEFIKNRGLPKNTFEELKLSFVE